MRRAPNPARSRTSSLRGTTTDRYDAVVVGARAAGAATAMLLARQGRRVLALDRAPYGSDTPSTHALLQGGVLQLHRWGLLDRIAGAGAPALRRSVVHTDRVVVELPVPDEDGIDALYAPRRTLLDPVLADAAVEAGAEVRFDTPVEGVLRDPEGRVVGVAYRTPGGGRIEARAPITVGADGVRSLVAREVDAPRTLAGSHASCAAWAYFEGDGFDGYRWFFRSEGAAGVIPTDGGMLVYAALPAGRFADDLRPDVEAGFWRSLRRAAPEAVEAIGPRARTSRFHLHAGVVGFHRRCHGPGWVLVGDASHHKDPLSAHGLTDALRDAELLARAVGPHLDDPAGLDAANAAYEARRDELSRPLFDVVDRLASHRWTPDEVMGLLVAMSSHTGEELAAIRGLDADRTSDSARARIPAGT